MAARKALQGDTSLHIQDTFVSVLHTWTPETPVSQQTRYKMLQIRLIHILLNLHHKCFLLFKVREITQLSILR